MKGEIKNLIRSIIIGLILAFLEWVPIGILEE